MATFPCPYVYPSGDRYGGRIVKVEAFNTDLRWTFDESGNSIFSHSQRRSHFHLFCSEKGNHADDSHPEQMMRYTINMPDELLRVIASSAEQLESAEPIPSEG
jgi:hypothetical protein